MKLLFIDHICHKTTHSFEFVEKILQRRFIVEKLHYSRFYRTGAKKAMKDYDIGFVWEFPVSRFRFYFPGKISIFVPMYDNEWGSYWQWRRIAWSGMGVISFCEKVTQHARSCGVKNLLDVRYFPAPALPPRNPGDHKKVFLWERGEINRQLAEVLFPPADGYLLVVKGVNDFWPREQYLATIASCGIVIAPRCKEGIGMAFLEAMAMGKCVVAHDDATMNEYIVNGVNGVLFDKSAPRRVDPLVVENVRENLAGDIVRYRKAWEADEEKINDFVAAQKPCRPSLTRRLLIMAAFPLYLAEGLIWRIRHR